MKKLIDGDPAEWVACSTARSLVASLFPRGGRLYTRRVIWAVDTFLKQNPPLTRSDVVAFMPRVAWRQLKKNWNRASRTPAGQRKISGLTVSAAEELTSHVVVFAIADIEMNRTPAPNSYVLYTTNPRKAVRHHAVLKRFNPQGYQAYLEAGGKPRARGRGRH